MSKNKKRNRQTAEETNLAETLGIELEGGDTEELDIPAIEEPAIEEPAIEEPAIEPTPVTDLDELINRMVEQETNPEMKEILRGQLNKVYGERQQREMQGKWQAFDTEFKSRIEALLTELLTKHGLVAENQQIIITFPDGTASYTRALEGSQKPKKASTSKRAGFPSKWGKAEDTNGIKYNSPSVMADSLGCLVNGKGAGYPDMVAVFDEQGHEVVELPRGAKLDELIAKQTDTARAERLASLAGDIFRVKA